MTNGPMPPDWAAPWSVRRRWSRTSLPASREQPAATDIVRRVAADDRWLADDLASLYGPAHDPVHAAPAMVRSVAVGRQGVVIVTGLE